MNQQDKLTVIQAIDYLLQPNHGYHGGSCTYIEDCLESEDPWRENVDDTMYILMALASTWSKYSGSARYPVPPPTGRGHAGKAYMELDLWEGEYGDLRREYLRYLKTQLEQD